MAARLVDNEDNWIWVTEGFGSVGECKKDPHGAFDLHVKKTHELIHRFPKSNLVFFSTNYVSDETNPASMSHPYNLGSEYAVSKALLEEVVRLARPFKKNVWAVRVANLYSKYNPWNSFAGRLLKARQNGAVISLPENLMIPTDTDWLADQLMMHFDRFRHDDAIVGIAPTGAVSTRKFGEAILGMEVGPSLDQERPQKALIYNSFRHSREIRFFDDHWTKVWNGAVEYRKALGLPELHPVNF